jgi:hypothetical protein
MFWHMHSQERMKMLRLLLCAISIIQPNWIIEARDEWKNDEKVLTLIQRLQ